MRFFLSVILGNDAVESLDKIFPVEPVGVPHFEL
jgi:hypothetical protein